jgi:hypothetical protein
MNDRDERPPDVPGGDLNDVDELEGTGDGEADAPVGFEETINANDPDPTAGASDIGGLAGGSDDVA